MFNYFKKLLTTHYSLLTSKGFTLIEMLVVMFLIVTISGIVFANFRAGDRNLALQRSAQLTTQAIAEALNHTLSGKEHGSTVSAGGYGIYFEQNSDRLIVFADCNSSGEYDVGGAAPSCAAATQGVPYPETFSEIVLETNITINSLTPCEGSPCALTVVFEPPVPKSKFTPVLTGSEAQIQLQHAGGGSITIYINALGVTRIE